MKTRPQPAPDGTTTEKLVDQLRERHAAGLAKYGVTLDRSDFTAAQWIQHHREELLDALGYLQRIEDRTADYNEVRERNIRLQSQLDQRWEMMRELQAECGTNEVETAVKYIKGLKERVKRLEEAGDEMQSAIVGEEGMTHWQWLAVAHEADLKWRVAKEAKP